MLSLPLCVSKKAPDGISRNCRIHFIQHIYTYSVKYLHSAEPTKPKILRSQWNYFHKQCFTEMITCLKGWGRCCFSFLVVFLLSCFLARKLHYLFCKHKMGSKSCSLLSFIGKYVPMFKNTDNTLSDKNTSCKIPE